MTDRPKLYPQAQTGAEGGRMKTPKLYPGHPHQWADTHLANWVACTVCGFEAPRTLANLDGRPAEPPPDAHEWGLDDWRAWGAGRSDTDIRCTHQSPTGQCLDHQGHAGDHQHPQPEQETRA